MKIQIMQPIDFHTVGVFQNRCSIKLPCPVKSLDLRQLFADGLKRCLVCEIRAGDFSEVGHLLKERDGLLQIAHFQISKSEMNEFLKFR